MVAFRPGVSPGLRTAAEQAIRAGRYMIFGGVEEGTATLLLGGEPRLVAVVRKAADEPGRVPSFDVLSVREAGPDIDRVREELGAALTPLAPRVRQGTPAPAVANRHISRLGSAPTYREPLS